MKIKLLYFIILLLVPYSVWSQVAASSNYAIQTGVLGSTYSWIDCSAGTSIVTGDDAVGSVSWPFSFSFYDNNYTSSNNLSVSTNGFIRLDGVASTDYTAASNYTLLSSSTELGQIIATSVYDCNVGRIGSSWVKYLVTGSAPDRILTIEYSDIEIGYNDSKYADVQVSFYETSNKIVLKFGTDNVAASGADLGIHSGVSGYFNKWQEVASGTNNAWIEYSRTTEPTVPSGPAASWNYSVQTGTTGSTYSWIDCSAGSTIVSGDDTLASVNWPFNFSFYDNLYTTSSSLSVATNGFIRLDGVAAGSDYDLASAYNLTSTATNLGQIIAMGISDDYVGRTSASWVRSLVTGTAPNRIFTIEYNNIEITYSAGKYADIQISFYESNNKIVLKFGADDVAVSGADIGIHSGVSGYFNKWKEVQSGTNNTWVEYSPPYVEANATLGTLTGYYPTLKAAFDKINDGTQRGSITVKIKASTTETSSAILNASGTGSSNYTSVNIYPTVTGLSITGNLATPLIDLNGADNVTIDGRVNATGTTNDLSIVNSSTASVAGTSTIRFINGATNNTVKYCIIKGSEILTTSGVLFFSTTTTGSGNSTNTIDNNSITNATNGNRPVNAIYSAGTNGKENSGNIISNNAIYNFLKQATASNGIFLSSYTTSWTIDGNSFYETTSFIASAAVAYNVIQIANTTGNDFIISNNYIGGSAVNCGGTPWTKTNATNNIFYAININVGTTTASSVQNNTIQNFTWSNAANAAWIAIAIAGGDVNIGTTTGNTIGAATGIGAVTVTGATTGLNVYGIYITGTGTVDCQNNTIGSITSANGATLASNIYGINKSAVAGTTIISNNNIGSTVTANSINASSTSTANAQLVCGIYNAGTGTIAISNNNISKLNNGTTNTTVGTLGVVNGITSLNGTITISNNTIYDLSITNANTNANSSASVCGMALTGTANAKTVTGNTIYNLSNTFSAFAGNVIGLYFAGGTSANVVSENFIYNLSVTGASSTGAIVYGVKIATGVTTYSNNIINLGGNTKTTVYGIYETGAASNDNNLYFNTVYISGSLVSGSTNKSYAMFSSASTNVRNFRNNIFMNDRSTTAGANLHYAAYFNYTASTNIILNYNDYFVSGIGGVMGYWNGANRTTLPIITGQDANSLNINPSFTTPGGTDFLDYYTAAVLPAVFGTGILTDYDGTTRNNPPKMGALESSLDFIWQGNTSTDFATASNWQNGVVPPNGTDISFAATPANDCYLDQNLTLKNITNTSTKKLVVNGKQLILTGNVIAATANQIDASSASCIVVFAGTAAQSIPTGAFVSNTIDGLTVNNSSGLIQNGAVTVQTNLTLTNGSFTIGANTLTLNGSITKTAGTLSGGSSGNIVFGGSGANTSLPSVTINNLTLNRNNGITLNGNVSVGGTLALTAGTLTVDANTLTIAGNAPVRTNGSLDASNVKSNILFSNASGITLPASLFNGAIQNLTINGGGITAGSDITVNGVLDLQNVNPSDTKALLDMVINWNDYPGTTNTNPGFNNLESFILYMGATATTKGLGDVSGVVKRTTILSNTAYAFGNQFTTVNISDAATVSAVTMTIRVGNLPGHSTTDDAVKRHYEMVPILVDPENVSATSNVNMNFHYLDSELNGNVELNLTTADYDIDGGFPLPDEHGRADYDFSNNFIGLSNVPLNYFVKNSTHVWRTIFFLREFQAGQRIWNGSVSTDWNDPLNWSPTGAGVPTASNYVLIPDATTTTYDPVLPSTPPTINTMTIEAGGVLVMGDKTINIENTMSGGWEDQSGLSDPGTSKVVFLNPGATISGIPVFNDIEIGNNATVTNQTNAHVKISGSVTRTGTGKWYASIYTSTVEYNKEGAQNVIIPDGSLSYNNLVLSGSGIKTMPVTGMSIAHDFLLEGTVTATAASSLTIGGELEIQEDATFATGAFDHIVGGLFDNAGTFIPTAGHSITLNGTAVQNIYGGSAINFENLIIDNSAGVDIFADIAVNDLLTLTNGNLNVGATILTINGDISKTSGYINVNTLSSLYFGGTTLLTTAADLFATAPSISNLTINRAGGVVFGSDITVNGILNLISTNPTAFKGSLDLGTNTLNMGATATTTGMGDVTGRVKRTTILPNIEYTFGNQFSSVTFPNIGTMPTEITLKISIGSVPTWKTDGLKRVYDICQIGGNGTKAIIKSHYLDSELNGNSEINISFFGYIFPSSTLLDRGVSQLNTTDNWITLNNTDFGNLPAGFGVIEHGFGVSTSNVLTWDGSESTDWSDQYNWTPAYNPGATKTVIIPDAATTPNDPIIAVSSSSSVNKLSIQPGGILNAGAGSQLTVVGTSGAWSNSGTFNASTGKVIFNSGIPAEIVTVAGVTNFYNIEVGANTTMQPVAGSTIRIAGAGTADATSIIDFSTIGNTVEWNGTDQTIVVPNGIGGNSGYYNLILCGSGTKTIHGTALNIYGGFTTSGTAIATAANAITVNGNTTIETGSAFSTGNFNHLLAGNFENNGTFTGTSGGTITFNGTTAQTISGTSTISFYNLTIDNVLGVTQAANVNVNNVITFNNGTLIIGAYTLGVNGTISNPSGNITVSTSSNLNFGGTTALTINNNLFSSNPSIHNLTINRTGGVTLGNQSMTVNGTLDLQAGTLTLAANSLTIAGNTLTRTTGNINASNTSATLAFTNSAAITLPASVITGNINNLTVNGAGINAGEDISINGVLSLLSANQSATVGSLNMSTYTLNMGATATTTGTGDVTGIVKRQHTFTNDVEYSFGNQFTTLNFLGVSGGVKPTWVSCKVEIGTVPEWRDSAVRRIYCFLQSGGTDRAYLKLHYLDSELNTSESDESRIIMYTDKDGLATGANTVAIGKNSNNVNDNWVEVLGVAINQIAVSSTTYAKAYSLGYTNVSVITWTGLGSPTYPGDWSIPGNWLGGIPTANDSVVIPSTLPSGNSGYPYRNLLSNILPSVAKSIKIEEGASLSVTDFNITVYGDGNAWVNNGSFIPGTGNVIFANGNESETVTISGTSNFNNLTITNKTHLHLATNSITRVAGILNAISGSNIDFTTNVNLVEYNGNSAQSVINPSGDANPGYHNLVFSGSGTKTLPASSLNIEGDLTTNAAVSASGNTLVMNGTDSQSIVGSVAPTLNNFTISNVSSTVTAGVNIGCSGNFTNSGDFDMTTYALAVASTITNTGTVKTASVSATPLPSGKTWGGTVQYYTTTGGQTVMAGTYNNLTLSNTSGTQTASGNVTVNSTLITTSGGVLNMGTNQLLGTLSTITNGGTIQTENTSATPIPTGKTWGGTVQYNALTGGQTTMAGTYSTLTQSNTSGSQTANGDIAATILNTGASGTFNMATYALSGLTTVSNLGTLETQNASSTPFTSGLTWGGTVIFNGTSSQTLPTPSSTFNNVTISNTAGVTATANQTVNGILNLSIGNPDGTHGSLDMSIYTLHMGASSENIGFGDVTGIVTRNVVLANVKYTFGNPYTSVTFPNVGTLPGSISLKTTIGTSPSWGTPIQRIYEFIQSGGDSTQAIITAHYLDSELDGNVESKLMDFSYRYSISLITEHGRSNINTTENWILLANVNIAFFPAVFGAVELGFDESSLTALTWNGSVNTSWITAENWTPNGGPSADVSLIIPAASTTPNDPVLSMLSSCKSITIESGGIINSQNDAELILTGAGSAWSNEGGTLNANTSNIIFANIAATINGTTDFYNLTIPDTAALTLTVGSVTRIAGTLINNGKLNASLNENIVEYNGTDQTVIEPVSGSDVGYEDLIISGTGTKTLPATLHISGDFTNNGTVDASGSTVSFSGNGDGDANEIGGSSISAFNNVVIANMSESVNTTSDITVSGTISISTGCVLIPGIANTIGGAGTLTGNGTAKVTRIAATPDMATQYPISTKTLTNLTVDYCGTGNQTVNAFNYGTLLLSANGTRTVTLAGTGTIGVSGVFNPDLTSTTYSITGSTMECNGTGSQAVPAFNYYNVIVSGNRGGGTITLVNGGTIGIAGHSTVSATNANYIITNNTININGSNAQTLDPFTSWNVIFSNSGIKTTTGNLVVAGSFTVIEGSTLDMAAYTLTSPYGGSISNSGTIKTTCPTSTSATPLPSGKTWGGTIEYTGSDAQTVVTGTYNNLTMSGAGGGTIAGDLTVNGVLNLLYENPLTTQGILHTGSNILSMGASATTNGIGDVTGIVKRQHTFVNDLEYSFGNQFTTIKYLGIEGSIKPSWVSCKIEIGSAPVWRTTNVKRVYSFLQSGGTDRTYAKLHYLDSELNASESDESKIFIYTDMDGLETGDNTVGLGKSTNDNDDNWVELLGMAINQIATSSTTYAKAYGLGYTNVSRITWTGLESASYPGDWSLPGNWLGGVPNASNDVLIPTGLTTAYPYRNLLSAIAPANVKTLEIEEGATVALNDYDITISGDTNAWVNNGTFNAGTGNIVFNNGSTLNRAEIAGTTNFYNLTVSDNTKIEAYTGSIIRIAGSLTLGNGSISDFITNPNTLEYNGSAAQTVVNPGASYGYYNLIFSGNGIKTLPSSTLSILGNLTVNSGITATGNTLAMEGVIAQIINGTNPALLNDLTIDNAVGVTLNADALATIRETLLINSGKKFEIAPASQLTVSGTLTNNADTAGFVLHSDATGTASLLHNTDNVPATVERYMSGNAEDWHFLSSPVEDQSISGTWLPSGTYGNGTGYDLYLWNEPSSCWIYKLNITSAVNWTTVHPASDFTTGRGYLYSVQDTTSVKEFAGNLNNGSLNYPLTYSSTVDSLKGFNLVGNPYPSSIDWKAAAGWTRTMLQATGGGYDIWIWNQAENNYGVYNSNDAGDQGTNSVSRYIAPMQGYFVRTSADGNLSMNNSIRVHEGAANWFKNSVPENNSFCLRVISDAGLGSDEIKLGFDYAENENGAKKLFSNVVTAPSLYMTEKAENLSIRYLTNTDENTRVPVNFTPGMDGNYTITCNFDPYRFETVKLLDQKIQKIQDIKSDVTYNFKASKTDAANRFILYFGADKNGSNYELPARIFTDGANLNIDLTLVNSETTILIYDALGRVLLKKDLQGLVEHKLGIKVPPQILLIQLQNQQGSISRKVFYQNNY